MEGRRKERRKEIETKMKINQRYERRGRKERKKKKRKSEGNEAFEKKEREYAKRETNIHVKKKRERMNK